MITDRQRAIDNLKKLRSFHNGSYGSDINIAIKDMQTVADLTSDKSEDDRAVAAYFDGEDFGYDIGFDDACDKMITGVTQFIDGCNHCADLIGDEYGVFAIAVQAYQNVLNAINECKAHPPYIDK